MSAGRYWMRLSRFLTMAASSSTLRAARLPRPLMSVRPDALNRLSIVRGSLTNLAKRSLSQLTALVKTRLKRMQYRPGLLDGFLASTGLDLTPFGNPL